MKDKHRRLQWRSRSPIQRNSRCGIASGRRCRAWVRAGVQPAPRTPFGDALRQVPPDHILAGAVFGQNLADKQPQRGQRWVEPLPVVARFHRHDVGNFLDGQNIREYPVSALGKLMTAAP